MSLRLLWRPATQRTLLRLSAELGGRGVQLLILVAVARRFDEGVLGTLLVGAAAGLLVGQAADLGLGLMVGSDVARRLPTASRSIGSALAAKVVLTGLGTVLLTGLYPLLGGTPVAAGAVLLAVAMSLDSFVQFSATSLRAAGAYWHDWAVALLPRAMAFVFVVPVALAMPEPRIVAFAWLCAAIAAAALALFILSRQLVIAPPRREALGSLLRRSWPIGASVVAGMAYTRVGLFMLEGLRSSQEVALYAIASRLMEPAYVLPAAAAAIFFPSYVRTLHDRPRFAAGQLRRWITGVAALGVTVYAAMALLGEPVARLLFGPFFTDSGTLLKLLGLVVVPGFTSYLLNQALIARGMARYNLTVMTLLLVISLAANAVVIGPYGIWGAAGVAVGIEGLLLAAFVWRIRRPYAVGGQT